MRQLITSLALLFVCVYAHAQFPAFPSKMPLGVQTTALGIESYGSTAPFYNPANVLHDTYLYRDTVLDISWRWSATDEAWQAMGLFFRSSAPPEFQTTGGVTSIYATGFWVDATNNKTHYFDFDLGEWVQFGTAGAADSLAVLQDSIIALYSEGLEIARDTVRFPTGLTAQELSLSPSDTLSISNGNSVFLPYAQALIDTAAAIRSDFPIDTDEQNLSFNIDTLSIERGNSVILPYRQALIDTAASIRGDFPIVTDNQTLSAIGDSISISGGNTIASDNSRTNEGALSVGAGTATTSLIQSNTAGSTPVTLSAGTNVSLAENTGTGTITINSPFQTLSVAGNNISISGGNTVAGDNNIANEGSLSVGAGTATTALIQSNTVGSPVVTLSAGSNVTITENTATSTITISSTGSGGDDGNGIYDGSGTVPNGTVAETTGSFRVGRNTTFLDVNSTSGNTELSASGSIILTGGSNGIAGKGNVTLSNETGEQARLSLAEDPANGNNTVSIRPTANMASNWTFILPATAGAADDVLTITNVTGSTVTTAWASAGSSGTTELADQYTIVGNGSFGNEFRVDTFVVGTVALVNNSYVAALEHADILFANVPVVESFYVSGDTVFLATSDSLYFAQLPSATPLSAGYGINIASNIVSVDTSLVSTVSNVENSLQTSLSYTDSLFATAQTVDSFYLYGDTLFLVLSDGVFSVVLDSVSGGLTWLKPELEAGRTVSIAIADTARLILNMPIVPLGQEREALRIKASTSSDENFSHYVVLHSPFDSTFFTAFDNRFRITHYGDGLEISSNSGASIAGGTGATLSNMKIANNAAVFSSSAKGAEIVLEDNGTLVNTVSIKARDTVSASYVIELPNTAGSTGDALVIESVTGDTLKTAWGEGSGGGVTASNGLTETAGDVKLGGALTEHTTIAGGEFELSVTSSGVNRTALTATSSGLYGVRATSNAGTAAFYGTTANATTNTVLLSQYLERSTTGTAADGIGQSLIFACETSAGISFPTNTISSLWATANNSTRTSRFIITGTSGAASYDMLTLQGNGQLRLNAYTTNAQIGTGWGKLAVDATGVVVVDTTGSSGGTDDRVPPILDVLGVAAYDTNLGAFSEGIIPNNSSVKAAIQTLEEETAGLLSNQKTVSHLTTTRTITSIFFSDITGLSFPVVAGTYEFEFMFIYGGVQIDFSVNGPTFSSGGYQLQTDLFTRRSGYDQNSPYGGVVGEGTNSIGVLKGIYVFTASGTLQARCRASTANGTILAGSTVTYRKIN